VETSDTFLFHTTSQKICIDQKKPGYVYVLDGIVTANGEVGISGSQSSTCNVSPPLGRAGRAERQQPVNYGIVVNNFNFNFNFNSAVLFSQCIHESASN
jgi:hypothetical protein